MNDEHSKLVAETLETIRQELTAFIEDQGTGLAESTKQCILNDVMTSSISVVEGQGSKALADSGGLDAHIKHLKDEAKMKIHVERDQRKK